MTKFFPLIWKNLGRNKTRSLLTGGAIALAVTLVCLLQTMPAGLDSHARQRHEEQPHLGAQQGRRRLPDALLLHPEGPRAARRASRRPAGTWFGGAFEEEKGVTFPNFAVSHDDDRRRIRGLEHRPAAAGRLPPLPRRRDRRPATHGEIRLEGRRPDHAEEHVFPIDLDAAHRGRDPERAGRRCSGSNASIPTQALRARTPAYRRSDSARSGCASTIRRG